MVFASAFLVLLAAAAPDAPVTLHGIGELRVGLGAQALRDRFRASREEGFDPDESCSYWRSPDYPGLGLMVVDGRLVRIDIDEARYRTASGAQVGMSEDRMLALYRGRMRVERHPYTDPDGKYLVYEARDEPFGLIAETHDGRVISMRVGYWDNVQWIEGCS